MHVYVYRVQLRLPSGLCYSGPLKEPSRLEAMRLADFTDARSSHPCGLIKHLPVDPLLHITQVEQRMPSQCRNPPWSPFKIASSAALSPNN